MTARLQALLHAGVAEGVFPRGWAVVRLGGERVFDGGAGGAAASTIFDLASLTKVMGTTAVFLSLWAEGKVEPETAVSRHFPGTPVAAAGITVGDLLAHRSGLPAFVPLFAPAMGERPALFAPDCPPAVRAGARRAVVDAALATSPALALRTRAIYSDVGFLVLGELLGVVGAAPLDALVAERVARPLGLAAGFRRLSAAPGPAGDIAPTGATRPRAPAPGQEGTWAPLPSRPSPPGEVDDDNAWVMDGVAGHAGLFGTAADVAAFGQAALDELAGAGRLAPPGLWARALARDTATPGGTRALGFDTRLPGDAAAGASAGRYVGQVGPGAVGHLGFTGCSLWIDRARRLVVALCTNRTALGRAETRIRQFRPRFHDAVVEELGLVG
ncbi:MAG TPA: serine hydrolase domain-containing protein [Methylomirabilota bacterium]|nr:serine hydrolase domain-containing protein [Methylomirabilota bacterium]